METPLVSIGMSVWNGDQFLAETLDSLLAQDYENIEVVILDNLSTDGTSAICKAYADKDSRIHYILDTQSRNVMEGQKKVFSLTRGEYFMIACDDDIYSPSYVSSLLSLINADKSVGMAYSAYEYITPDGVPSPSDFDSKYFLTRNSSMVRNFMRYLVHRNPVPIVFGLVRAEVQKDALQYYVRVDLRGWSHDNLYILRILSRVTVNSTQEILFRYRQRDRIALYQSRGQLIGEGSSLRKYLNDILHQVAFTAMVRKIVKESFLSFPEKIFLQLYVVFVFFRSVKKLTRGIVPFPRKLLPRISRKIRHGLK